MTVTFITTPKEDAEADSAIAQLDCLHGLRDSPEKVYVRINPVSSGKRPRFTVIDNRGREAFMGDFESLDGAMAYALDVIDTTDYREEVDHPEGFLAHVNKDGKLVPAERMHFRWCPECREKISTDADFRCCHCGSETSDRPPERTGKKSNPGLRVKDIPITGHVVWNGKKYWTRRVGVDFTIAPIGLQGRLIGKDGSPVSEDAERLDETIAYYASCYELLDQIPIHD